MSVKPFLAGVVRDKGITPRDGDVGVRRWGYGRTRTKISLTNIARTLSTDDEEGGLGREG